MTFVGTCLFNVFVNPRMTLTICKVLERVWEKSCISQEGSSCQADRFFSFFSLTDKKINWFVRNSFLDWMGFHFVFCKISLPLPVGRTTNCPLKRNLLICFRPQDSLSRNLQRYIYTMLILPRLSLETWRHSLFGATYVFGNVPWYPFLIWFDSRPTNKIMW